MVAALAGALAAESSEAVKSVVKVDRRTGRLVRVVVAPQNALPAKDPAMARAVQEAVETLAREHSLDPALVHSVIEAESNYNPYAVSPKGAQGLMQLMPATARRFGVNNAFRYTENLEGGMKYLRYLLDLFQDETLALAAYNAGERAVLRYGGVPPFEETRRYVRQVTGRYQAQRAQQAGHRSQPEPGEYRPLHWQVDAEGNLRLFTR